MSVEEDGFVHKLVVSNPTTNDMGKFTCDINNITTSAYLDVEGKSTVTTDKVFHMKRTFYENGGNTGWRGFFFMCTSFDVVNKRERNPPFVQVHGFALPVRLRTYKTGLLSLLSLRHENCTCNTCRTRPRLPLHQAAPAQDDRPDASRPDARVHGQQPPRARLLGRGHWARGQRAEGGAAWKNLGRERLHRTLQTDHQGVETGRRWSISLPHRWHQEHYKVLGDSRRFGLRRVWLMCGGPSLLNFCTLVKKSFSALASLYYTTVHCIHRISVQTHTFPAYTYSAWMLYRQANDVRSL